jgi:hypothetical protein
LLPRQRIHIIPFSNTLAPERDNLPDFTQLDGSQIRQLIDTEQLYAAYREAQRDREQRFRGSMTWKRVGGREYLYRKRKDRWESLGRRSGDTELILDRFRSGRAAAKARMQALDHQVRRNAPINKAMGLGRVPWPAARLLRKLDRYRLLGGAISIVGTHALYAYERMAGGHFASGHVATQDIDLLYDRRDRLRFFAPDMREEGLQGILREVDSSFQLLTPRSYQAVNDAGFLVDLIMPLPRQPALAAPGRIGTGPDDMTAAEIEGLSWLQSSPHLQQTAIDEKGFPVPIDVPDPRAFALHKLWVSERADRDPMKARRDAAQARAVAWLVLRHLPHLRFDDDALSALPQTLRARAQGLVALAREDGMADGTDW